MHAIFTHEKASINWKNKCNALGINKSFMNIHKYLHKFIWCLNINMDL